MKRFLVDTVKRTARALAYGLVGSLLVIVVGFVVFLERRSDLEVWHTAELDAEFTASSSVSSFEDYLRLEERLFAQLDERVYTEVGPEVGSQIQRYHRGSLADPGRWPRNWNRSFEWSVPEASAGVLLLHGMSDSPYSMRSLSQRLHAEGAWVLGLRIPGHGTAPSGLVDVQWEDMAAAVRLAMRHLREKIGERPLYIVGYSNGGALAVHYALLVLEDASLPTAQGLVLISPEIGITKLAALAVWQERLGHVLGLGKLAWNSILPEYDPFKYQSFALNAGKQAHRLTAEVQSQITKLGATGDLERLPPLLAFQSVVDATVSAPALVEGLFERLPAGEHELVLFDINRFTEIEPILKGDPQEKILGLLRRADLGFAITLVTNASEESRDVVLRQRRPGAGAGEVSESPLGLAWPDGLYSLSHVALPFPADDPLYGGVDHDKSPGIQIGKLALRGERGVLQISAADMLRLRWNPFHSYMEQRLLDFMHF
jgi:alpha-beta hydrolase superfamily lysophospholipase